MTVYWPNGSTTRPRVSSPFDPARKNPVTGIVQPHNGDDLVGWLDNMSPVDGTVVFAGYNGGAGNEVRIRADGPTAFHVGDYYRILHNAWLMVSTGQRVSARQPVGRMGTTGQSTGVHCHFETHEWRLWNPVNPTDYMRRANAGGSAAGDGGTPWEEPDMDATQAAQLARVAGFVDKLDEIRLFDGVPGVDLSTPRLRLALDASIDLRKRFVYVDEHGTPTYDLAQLAANEIKPMLLTLIAAIGRPAAEPGAPIDPAVLVSAIREALGDELAREVADELAARLAQ